MCGAGGEQYAHVVPESDGGAYELDNLIFLCWRCHNTWQEPARSAPEVKAKLIEVSRKLRDKEKSDGVLSSVFGWAAGERLRVTLGSGMQIIDQERILERRDDPSRPYLRLRKDPLGILRIDAYFDDADGNDFMYIDDNILKVHTSAAWDIAINRRKIRFEYADQKMRLEISQTSDMGLLVAGNLYLNGGYFEITEDRIFDVKYKNTLIGCSAIGNGLGFLLSPGQIAF
jgi:HNH endonuclease